MNENENNPLTDEPSEQTTDNGPSETPSEDSVVKTEDTAQPIPPSEQPEQPERQDASEPTVLYRWDYTEQKAEDARRRGKDRRSGVLTFAIVMSACFLLTLLVLVGAIVSGELTDWMLGAPSGDGTLNVGDGQGDALSLQQISAKGNEVVVAVSVKTPAGSGSGTGIVMTEDGYIATNHHVIENATEITVQLYSGKKYEARLIGSSESDDLAVLKIEARGLTAAVFGDSSEVAVGDRAVVIGHPAGLEFGWTSTYGFVSAINRNVKIRDTDGTLIKKMTLLQTDANVNNGNSGGPMFNDRGEVIGIITLKLAGDYEGMGFAIPSNGAVPLLEALMKTGTTDGVESEVSSQRPQLGITGVAVEGENWYVMNGNYRWTLTEEQAAQIEDSFYAEVTGVRIFTVDEASDAYGKIREGDIITALDGHAMANMDLMREYLYDLAVGDTVEITFVREGVEQSVSVTLTPPSN